MASLLLPGCGRALEEDVASSGMGSVDLQKKGIAFPAAPGSREQPAGQGVASCLLLHCSLMGIRHCVGSGESELN